MQDWHLSWLKEAYRVLKPGGPIRIFSATRTYHRVCKAVVEAGFEGLDLKAQIFASGFPKSLNIGKALDKAGGQSPQVQATVLRRKREAAGMSREEVALVVGCTVASVRDWEEGRARATGQPLEFITPSQEYREKLADLLGYSSDERKVVGLSANRQGDKTVLGVGHTGVLRTGGHTELAKIWEGWGTALKPAYEPIVCARKPLG